VGCGQWDLAFSLLVLGTQSDAEFGMFACLLGSFYQATALQLCSDTEEKSNFSIMQHSAVQLLPSCPIIVCLSSLGL
jgi:hypothetical protein